MNIHTYMSIIVKNQLQYARKENNINVAFLLQCKNSTTELNFNMRYYNVKL